MTSQGRRQDAKAVLIKGNIRVEQSGVFIFVGYPYRKTPDLYTAIKPQGPEDSKEGEAFCAQCQATFPATLQELCEHIWGHDRRKSIQKLRWVVEPVKEGKQEHE